MSRSLQRVVEAGDDLSWRSGWFADEWFVLSDVAAFFGGGCAVDAVHVVGLVEGEGECQALLGDWACFADGESSDCHP